MISIRALFASFTSISWWAERQLRHKSFAAHRLQPPRKHLVLATLSALALLSFFPSLSADEHASTPIVVDLNLHGVVEPILATYIAEGIADAERRQAALILITMDTPGGLSDSMQDIIKHILASRVPVAVYITPTGARGASAGFFILLSADIAAMAPGTHTGAASPVIAIGGWQLQVDETMKRKILNDALAFLRSYAEKRGRNPTLAETAVTDAKAFTDKEALDGKLIDLVAPTVDDLVRQLDGREITRFDGTKTKLSLSNARLTPFELSGRQKFLARIVEPDVFFVLLIIGVLGLYTEFTHPFCAPDHRRPRSLHGVHPSGSDCPRGYRRHLYGAGSLRHAHSSRQFRRSASHLASVVAVYSRGEIHQPWRAACRRRSVHVARRHVSDSFAANRGRRQPGRGRCRYAALCRALRGSDAPGATLA